VLFEVDNFKLIHHSTLDSPQHVGVGTSNLLTSRRGKLSFIISLGPYRSYQLL